MRLFVVVLLAVGLAAPAYAEKEKEKKKEQPSSMAAQAPSIHPRKRKPGKKFVIIDRSAARLVDPSKAVFTQGSKVIEVDLTEGKKHRVAVGKLPTTIPAGKYTVSVKTPSATFPVGDFEVRGAAAASGPTGATGATPEDPDIEPIAGPPGTAFSVTDARGRIVAGDQCNFYPEGTPPANGIPTTDAVVSADGKSINAKVPGTLDSQTYAVGVKPSPAADSRFTDLIFVVE